MQKHLQKLLLIVAMMVAPWVTQGQAFHYTCNFDNDSDTAGWVFVKRKSFWGILFGDETLVTLYQRPINSSYSFPM